MNKQKDLDRFMSKVGAQDKNGCWPWIGALLSTNYGVFRFNGKNTHASRASYLLHIGEIKPGNFVCHSCDNRACVNPAHLWQGTAKDNVQDMVKKGRHRSPKYSGSCHPSAKLTEEDIPKIRSLLAEGKTQRHVAKEFNVSQRSIWDIEKRRLWRHA